MNPAELAQLQASAIRHLINQAKRDGALRAADCRQILNLEAAGLPKETVISYIQAMMKWTTKARNRYREQLPQDVSDRRPVGLSDVIQASQEPGDFTQSLAEDERIRVSQNGTHEDAG
jgi:hypothetical protein